ncbi:hypothetical protein GCM10019016_128080 [Streptomyces prasinosporus]|uniref:Uncharacterized protein n=1 Tax=Streptomyces prasinosporus TaxID=68256 RepID=A0ABP6UES0_9ACTN
MASSRKRAGLVAQASRTPRRRRAVPNGSAPSAAGRTYLLTLTLLIGPDRLRSKVPLRGVPARRADGERAEEPAGIAVPVREVRRGHSAPTPAVTRITPDD